MTAHTVITEHLDIWSAAHKTRSSAGRGSSNKLDLYGIKKLRELILELAVRGKLVPQDESDEPASELVKRIETEKSTLVKEGRLKKQKPLLPISESEELFDLPNGWVWERLNNIYDVRDGTHDTPKYHETGYPLVTSKNLSSGVLDLTDVKFISESDHLKIIERSKVDSEDILFAMIGSIGNPVLVDVEPNFSIKNVALFKYYKKSLSSPSFLLRFLVFASVKMKQEASGAVQSFVSLGTVRNFPIALPPLPEQHRIVAKVDELMALCDQLEQTQSDNIAAHAHLVEALLDTLTNSCDHNELQGNWQRIAAHFDTLFTTEHSIEQLKQTILQLAVMGKLVPQNPNDEPASELLKKIAAEKALLIKEGKIKKEKSPPSPPFSKGGDQIPTLKKGVGEAGGICDVEQPFELPSGWEWVRFSDVAHSRLGKMLDKAKNSGNMKPYLRNTNVQWGVIELEDIKMMKLEDTELFEFKLEYGDLLICEGGYPGRCAIWKHKNIEMYFQKALHRARVFSGVKSEFLQLCLFNDLNTGGLDKYISGATIQHFTGDKLDKYLIPMAPSNEQHRIVAKVDELMALCDTLKTKLQNAQTTQLALADALVEQAIL